MPHYHERQSRFEFKTDPQYDHILIGPGGGHYNDERSAMFGGQLGFCLCGDPISVHELAVACLECFDRDKHGFEPGTGVAAIKAIVEKHPKEAAYFIAYVLDKCDLTEHGGSVGGSWLTDRGKQFIEIGPMKEDDEI